MALKKRAEPREKAGEIPPGAKRIELVWRTSDDEPAATFADNLHVRRINEQVYLTFGQVIPPFDLESAKPGQAVRAEIRRVARVVVTVETLKRIVNLLEQQKGRLIDL
jgi:hypothetical protein